MTQIRRNLDEYFFGGELPNWLATVFYGACVAFPTVSTILWITSP